MTPEEIDAMPAGREMDELVARHVLGYSITIVDCVIENDAGKSGPFNNVGHYSTDIAAAWQVVEKFEHVEVYQDADGWHCRLGYWDTGVLGHGVADTAPLAICRAALKARLNDGT